MNAYHPLSNMSTYVAASDAIVPPIDTAAPLLGFTLLASPMMRITRNCDIRRVHNSDDEFRISMDVPGAQHENIDVCLITRNSSNTSTKAASVAAVKISGTVNGTSFSKTLDLPSTSLDLSKVHAHLSSQHGILEIVAPKSSCSRAADTSMAGMRKIPVMHANEVWSCQHDLVSYGYRESVHQEWSEQ